MSYIIVKAKELRGIPDFSHLSESSLARKRAQIRDFVGKKKKQPVTIYDVAEYLGISVENVQKLLTSRDLSQ